MKRQMFVTLFVFTITAGLCFAGCGEKNAVENSTEQETEISTEVKETVSVVEKVEEIVSEETEVTETFNPELPYMLNEKSYNRVELKDVCSICLPENMEIGDYSKYAGFGGGYIIGPNIYSGDWEVSSDTLSAGFVGLFPKEFYVFNIGKEGFINPEKVTPSPKSGYEEISFEEVVEGTVKPCIIYSYRYDMYEAEPVDMEIAPEDMGAFWIAYIVNKDDAAAVELKFSKALFTLEEVEFMAKTVLFE